MRLPHIAIASAILLETTGLASPVFAQEPAIPSGDEATAISDIIVTARRRSESLQATPIAVTALSGESLEARQVTSLDDLADIAPSLTINGSSAFSGSSQTVAVFMRGIGQTDFTLNTDPGVGIYVDGVYISRSVGALLDLVNIDRVEVLRGPQGTLFGRNSVGGAISITSRRPGPAGGRVWTTVGSHSLLIVGGQVDLPVSETLRTSLSVQHHEQDGYVTRLEDGQDLGDRNNLSAKAGVLWTPSDKLDLMFDADFSRSRENGAPLVLVEVNPGAAIPAAHNILVAPQINPALVGIPGGCLNPAGAAVGERACYDSRWITGNLSTTNSTFPTFSNVDIWGVSLTANYRLDQGQTIKSITAVRNLDDNASRDGDGSPLQINSTEDILESRQFSQEIQWLGEGFDGRLNYIVGGYFFDEDGVNRNTVDLGFVRFLSGGEVHNTSVAAFGQATYELTDALSASVGLRYTSETRRFTPDQRILRTSTVPFFPPFLQFNVGDLLTTTERQTAKASELTPRLDLTYRPAANLMAYVSYSQGFKGGGFTQRIFPAVAIPPAFEPETATVYETGAKLDLFDRRLRINGAAYLTDYTDLQVTVLVGVAPTVQNAASARIKGLELEVTALPIRGLTASLSAGYIDAQYQSLDARVSPSIGLDNRFPGTSKWTVNSSIAYDFNVGDALVLTPRVDWSYRSRSFFDAENLVGQGGYGLVNASLTLVNDRAGWTVSVFGKNIGDESFAIHGEQVLDPLGWRLLAPGRGSEWGLRLMRSY